MDKQVFRDIEHSNLIKIGKWFYWRFSLTGIIAFIEAIHFISVHWDIKVTPLVSVSWGIFSQLLHLPFSGSSSPEYWQLSHSIAICTVAILLLLMSSCDAFCLYGVYWYCLYCVLRVCAYRNGMTDVWWRVPSWEGVVDTTDQRQHTATYAACVHKR